MNDLDPSQTVRQMTIRVPISTYLLLDDLARNARQPIAVVARDLLVGRAPKVAPPLEKELSLEARLLLKILHGAASNLTQASAHAAVAGEPLARLSTTPDGVLFKMGSRVRTVALLIKGGRLDQLTTADLFARLEGPARRFNDELARPLNEGAHPEMGVWKDVLDGLQNALLEGAE